MATSYSVFDTTPATLVADIKTKILLSSDWANITGNIVKTTTTRGAQMVVDLADASATSNRMQLAVYRTHDGTTGVDKVTRYITYNNQTPATSTPLHVTLSVGKEHFYLTVEGPRFGETGTQNSSWGSERQCLLLCDLVPYHAADTQPAVVLCAHTSQNLGDSSPYAYVSRDQGSTRSWSRGFLYTMSTPPRDGTQTRSNGAIAPVALGDGKYYVWPYVFVDAIDGLRGRLNKTYFAGGVRQYSAEETPPAIGTKITYGTEGMSIVCPLRSSPGGNAELAIGYSQQINGGSASPTGPGNGFLVAVPNGL